MEQYIKIKVVNSVPYQSSTDIDTVSIRKPIPNWLAAYVIVFMQEYNTSLQQYNTGFDDDDCFAEILKDDIVNLGKPILPSTPDILPVVADKAEHEKRLLQLTEATPLHILPVQGKANRRIRMGQQQPEKYHVEEFIHPRLKQAITTSLLRNLSIQNRMNRQTVCWA
ncbi:hypothetical protein Vadar_000247 [Vaccinium darrowii]|uniref:Uncharacterized protein n=1 Tax=Vaccinium darrowii TaxID=229202 RepID=A0ACB7WWN4_9ERIC|nr:hypothetical protein Vadar_000247 [Vaccinium darrowii]